MRCRTCNYRLWNLESRRCPECGSPFLPSDFDFAPGSVQFCCPHCKQSYYATDSEGHLVPRDFDCVQCGNHIEMDEMILLPTEGLEEEQTDAPYHPWLDRRKVGRFKGWLSTIWLAMTGPVRLMQLAPKERSTGQAWWFAIITNVLAVSVGFGPFLLLPLLMTMGGGPQIGFWRLVGALPKFALVAVILICAGLLAIVLWGLLAHGLLRLTGRTSGPLSRTLEAICYSSGANIATGVPCLGYYFGWIWWCISAVFTLKTTHKVSGGRAALAALLPPGLLIVSAIALWVYVMFGAMSSPNLYSMGNIAAPRGETQIIVDALILHAEENADQLPTHAIELVVQCRVIAWNLTLGGSHTFLDAVPVGGTTLEAFTLASSTRQTAIMNAAVKALPEDVIAHRLGDFVFTFHGIDMKNGDPDLWIVIASPDPQENPDPRLFGDLVVGRLDGSCETIPREEFQAELVSQNALRAEHGLPPLPSPETVRYKRTRANCGD